MMRANRRQLLKTTGTAVTTGLVGIAGCMGDGGDGEGSPTDADTDDSGGQGDTESTPTETTAELEVLSYNVGTAAVPATMIEELGLDSEHNLDVEFAYRGDLGQMYRDYVLDRVSTLAASGPATVGSSRIEDRPVKYLSPVNQNHTTLITRPDAPYESIDDLVGQTVGWFGLPSEASLGLLLITKLLGYDLREDFQLERGAPGALLGLVQQGDLDAAIFIEPGLSGELAAENVKTVGDPFYEIWEAETGFDLMPIGGVATKEAVLEDNREGLEAFVSAKNDALERFTSDPGQWLTEPWMQEVTGLESDEAIEVATERLEGTYNYTWGDQGQASVEFYLNQAADTDMLGEVPQNLIEQIGP